MFGRIGELFYMLLSLVFKKQSLLKKKKLVLIIKLN